MIYNPPCQSNSNCQLATDNQVGSPKLAVRRQASQLIVSHIRSRISPRKSPVDWPSLVTDWSLFCDWSRLFFGHRGERIVFLPRTTKKWELPHFAEFFKFVPNLPSPLLPASNIFPFICKIIRRRVAHSLNKRLHHGVVLAFKPSDFSEQIFRFHKRLLSGVGFWPSPFFLS